MQMLPLLLHQMRQQGWEREIAGIRVRADVSTALQVGQLDACLGLERFWDI